MANLVPDNIKILMSQHTFEVDPDYICEDLSCIICLRLMVDAYQTYCGCKYCRECIITYLDEGNTHCRGSSEFCREENLVLDSNVHQSAVLNWKILRIRVRCVNQGCQFVSKLTDMEDHLRLCPLQPICCPYNRIGCANERASKGKIETHLHKDMLIHSELFVEVLDSLRNEVMGLRGDGGRPTADQAGPSDGNNMAKIEMMKLVKEQVDQLTEAHERRMIGIYEEKEKKDLVEEAYKKLMVQIESLGDEYTRDKTVGEARVAHLEMEVARLGIEIEKVREDAKKMTGSLESIRDEFVRYRQEAQLRNNGLRLQKDKSNSLGRVNKAVNDDGPKVDRLFEMIAVLQENTKMIPPIGSLSLTVDRFSARKTMGEVIFSPCFYSHANGYKLRLRVHPNGCADGYKTHMSVSFLICRGEYDDLLPWPCKYSVKISIIDQRSGKIFKSVIDNFINAPASQKYTFNKPFNKDNPGFGHSKFLSHLDLRSMEGLIVNDCVVLHSAVVADK